MSKFQKLIDDRHETAKYMVDEITHVCKNIPKRSPGTEGEKLACDYMAEVLMNDCACEKTEMESFKVSPDSFYGWIYITVTCALLACVLYFFYPLIGVITTFIGLLVMVLQFGFYFQVIDWLFKVKKSHNVTAIKKCTKDIRARVFFNGHVDAAWNFPVNHRWGGVAYSVHIITAFAGVLYIFGLCIARTVLTACRFAMISPQNDLLMFCLGLGSLVFIPFIIGVYFMWDEKVVVDGANDNLTGCYMGISVLKAMKDNGIELEHTEVGVIITGSEEAGLRGSKAWCKNHKGQFDDVPTYIYSFDTIHDSKFLMVNYRDLNGTVLADREVSDSFVNSAKELGIPCIKGMVPPFGGATDSAAFAQAGYKVAGITALNHALEDYYHTVRDSYDNLNEDCLADCFAVTVNVLKKIDESTKNRLVLTAKKEKAE